jgi:hypothetical protein
VAGFKAITEEMMQEWADFLEQTQRGGKVLPFRGTAA